MKIVITGAAGRIGRDVVRELEATHELVLLDRQPYPGCVRADLTRPGPRRRYGPDSTAFDWERHFAGADAILHLAGERSPTASLQAALRGNVESTWNVLQAAARHRVSRVVYASSNWAVRRTLDEAVNAGLGPIPEPDFVAPTTAYGLSKAAAELAGQMAVEDGSIGCFVAVRIGAVVWKPPREVVEETARRAALGVADLRTLLRLCLERSLSGFHLVYGISPSPDSILDLSTTRRLLDWSPLEIPGDRVVECRVSQTA